LEYNKSIPYYYITNYWIGKNILQKISSFPKRNLRKSCLALQKSHRKWLVYAIFTGSKAFSSNCTAFHNGEKEKSANYDLENENQRETEQNKEKSRDNGM